MPKEEKDFVDISNKPSVPAGLENAPSKDILDYLFANDNKLLTARDAEFSLSRDSQGLVAYFSGFNIK